MALGLFLLIRGCSFTRTRALLPPGHLTSAAPSAWNAFLPKSLWTAIHPTLSSVSTPTSPHRKVFSKRPEPQLGALSPCRPLPRLHPPSCLAREEGSQRSCLPTAGPRCRLRPRGHIEGGRSESRSWCLHSSPGESFEMSLELFHQKERGGVR